MRLTELTIAGFKSFAKTTTFSFTAPVSAVVGPNGSGKSNVAESIRWVLGEQSLKTLRGKKGEDLIFNGSPAVPRMGKASVRITLDNRDHTLPIDFDAVALERKIFRDGTNEYLLNGSPVRLKDIVELLARMGLGETKHNIIGQGEVDRILLASSRDRREMLEEAIGLRLWQLRKREAERKLGETRGNIERVTALANEIKPHVKFLKTQADKAERRDVVRQELEAHYRAFVQREEADIAKESARLHADAAPTKKRLAAIEGELRELTRAAESRQRTGGVTATVQTKERAITELEAKRRDLERELGRAEGRLEAARAPARPEHRRIAVDVIESTLAPHIEKLREALALDDIEALRQRITRGLSELEGAIRVLHGKMSEPGEEAENVEAGRRHIAGELKRIGGELARIRAELVGELEIIQASETTLRAEFLRIREREEEASGLRIAIERLAFEEEKLAMRRAELAHVVAESGMSRAELERGDEALFAEIASGELQKKISRLRVRLEEIGGIDRAVLDEYAETRARFEFLEKELLDLEAAEDDLRDLVAELESRIERDFRDGLANIRASFAEYFRIIFGGGKGDITYVPFRTVPTEHAEAGAAESDGEEEREYGIDIKVDLPRKRIRGLAMLSGGERALVSIALLFAITAVNPPPFLVLDETDAALDEANSQKYGAILAELAKRTQLVVITHNRETMKQAGILYGVTMGEDGVTKILSLKLEEAASYGNR